MGVEHALVCKHCKQWIELHKCYNTARIFSYEGPPKDNRSWDKIETYWGARALWFVWAHRNHGGSLEMINDADLENYYQYVGELDEVAKHIEAPPGDLGDDE